MILLVILYEFDSGFELVDFLALVFDNGGLDGLHLVTTEGHV